MLPTMLRNGLRGLVLVLTLGPLTTPADLLNAPDPIPSESGSTEVKDSNGKPRWSAEWTMEEVEKLGTEVNFCRNLPPSPIMGMRRGAPESCSPGRNRGVCTRDG